MYQALARMPRLKHLMLTLTCSGGIKSKQESFEGLREFLIQCAFDANLARSLIRKIDGSGTLQWLDLTVDASWGDDVYVEEMLIWIAQCWFVRKTGLTGAVVAEPTGLLPSGRARTHKVLTELIRGDFRDVPEIKEIWKSAWPGEPKVPGDWSDHWWSYPLGG